MKITRTRTLTLFTIFTITLIGCSTQNEHIEEVFEPVEQIADEITEEELSPYIVIADMSGRMVTIPTTINSVYGTNSNSTILLYTLAPQKMISWNLELSQPAKKYIKQEYVDLPVLGNMYGSGKKANAEEIISFKPDIVLIADTKSSEKVISAADDLQAKLGIPVVVLIANVHNYDKAYAFLGSILAEADKATKLADYYIETYKQAMEISATIEDDVINIYYAREDNGLTTEFAGSPNAELIELIGAQNVAVNDGKQSAGEVSIEQVLTWNPDVIVVGHKGAAKSKAYEMIKTDELWADIDAVVNQKVYNIPRFPFNWFDRPPTVNRIIGIKWLGNKIYPQSYDYNMVEEVKEFFKLFYGYELSDEEATLLIG